MDVQVFEDVAICGRPKEGVPCKSKAYPLSMDEAWMAMRLQEVAYSLSMDNKYPACPYPLTAALIRPLARPRCAQGAQHAEGWLQMGRSVQQDPGARTHQRPPRLRKRRHRWRCCA